jgi:hypothetical protein
MRHKPQNRPTQPLYIYQDRKKLLDMRDIYQMERPVLRMPAVIALRQSQET